MDRQGKFKTRRIICTVIGALLLWVTLAGCASLSSHESADSRAAAENFSSGAAYHYSLSVLLRRGGDLAGAIGELKQALEHDPDSPYLITELVSLYVENNDTEKALALGEEALARDPANIELRSIMGGLYFSTRDYDKAAREYETIITRDPKNLVAYLYLATIHAQEKKYDLAESAYQKLLAIDPDNIIGMYYYAKTLMQMQRWADAEELLQKTIAQRPAFEAAWQGLGVLYETTKRYDDAIGLYRSYLDRNPAKINYRVKIPELLKRVGRMDEAKKDLEEILTITPDSREVRAALGLLYYDMRNFAGAAQEFSRLLEGTPGDDKLRYMLASSLEQKGDHDAACRNFQLISPSFELFANAQIQAAMILGKQQRHDEAISVMVRALEQKNDQAVLYLYLSSLYEDSKDLTAAEKTIVSGIERVPGNTDLHYMLGVILDKTNRFEESIRQMEKVLEIDPQNADALNFIGYTYAERGVNLDEAEKLILQAMDLKPDNGYIIDSLGWVHFRQNKLASALKHLKRALELMPEDPNILEHLGDVYLKTGQAGEALDFYRRAIKISPDSLILKKKIDELDKTPR